MSGWFGDPPPPAAAVTWCPGCEAWQLEYDLGRMAHELLSVRLINAGYTIPDLIRYVTRAAAREVDLILLDHVEDCPPARAWLAARLERQEDAARSSQHDPATTDQGDMA